MSEYHYIDVKNLVKNYDTGKVKVNAVDHVSFCADQGEFIGIMGASGSGKSTILNILAAIDTMSEGQVFYDGTDISGMDEEELANFQDYNLLDTLSIEENIMIPMTLGSQEMSMARLKEEIDSRRPVPEPLSIIPS